MIDKAQRGSSEAGWRPSRGSGCPRRQRPRRRGWSCCSSAPALSSGVTADRQLEEAERLAERLEQRIDVLATLLLRVRLHRTGDVGPDDAVRRRAAQRFLALGDDEARRYPTLVRSAAAELGGQRADVLHRAIELLGVHATTAAELDRLERDALDCAAADPSFATWLDAIASRCGIGPGAPGPGRADAARAARHDGRLGELARRWSQRARTRAVRDACDRPAGGPAVSHLTPDELVRVRDAVDEAELGDPEMRPMLFDGVMRRYVRALPLLPAPMNQLHSDLTRMNQVDRLVDGTVPLEVWLRNAARLAVVADAAGRPAGRPRHGRRETSGEPELPPPEELGEIPEAIVHQDDTVPYDFLRLGWEAGTAVARLRVPQFSGGAPRKINNVDAPPHLGTGWLVTARAADDQPPRDRGARARGDRRGRRRRTCGCRAPHATRRVRLRRRGRRRRARALQRARRLGRGARLRGPAPRRPGVVRHPASGSPPRRSTSPRATGSPVNIIQHPMGESKRVAPAQQPRRPGDRARPALLHRHPQRVVRLAGARRLAGACSGCTGRRGACR